MVFRGLGFLVGVIIIATMLFGTSLLSSIYGEEARPADHPLYWLAVSVVSGTLTWFLGRFLNRKPLAVEELTERGREIVYYPRHTFFFIRIEYWGPILFVIFSLMTLIPRSRR